ncbi:coiled-coil domain-containing protein 158 [Spea bombifrons]|uniref:coiled-coil domain-containing protein 158 n=1 Tax=Spea bombifrons TaxID=233779 RepID=UPI00234AA47F|nr:coiled-coil domain-containing protein 158 [Spea bombifrons]
MASKTLQALRDEFEGQTREIQKLQREVELATQHTIKKLSASYRENAAADHCPSTAVSATSSLVGKGTLFPLLPNHNHITSLALHHSLPDDRPSPINSIISQSTQRPCGLEGNVRQAVSKSLVEEVSQCKDSQEKTKDSINMCGLQNQLLRQSIGELNSKIQSLEKERDGMLGLRLREPKAQEEVSKQFQELQEANQLQDEMLKQSNVYSELLREMVENYGGVLQEIQGALLGYEECSGRKVFESDSASSVHISRLGTTVQKALQDLESEASFLKGKLNLTEEQVNSLMKELQDKEALFHLYKERYDNAVKEHEQQMAVLTGDVTTAQDHTKKMQTQMEKLRKQTKDQSAHYVEKITLLESTVTKLGFEVEDLKMQLAASDSALKETRNEHEQCNQKLEDQLQQLSVCEKRLASEKHQNKKLWEQNNAMNLTNEHLRRELIERSMEVERLQVSINKLTEGSQQQLKQKMALIQENMENLAFTSNKLVSTKALLDKTAQELAARTMSLQKSEGRIEELKAILEEKDKTLRNTGDKLKKLRSQVEAKKQEAEQSRTEAEKLKNIHKDAEKMRSHLTEKDQLIKTMEVQVENLTQIIDQLSEKANVLQTEKSQLQQDVSYMKSKLEELNVLAGKKEARIHELEQEKINVRNEACELKMEKDDLKADLKVVRSKFANLTDNYEILKRNCQNKKDDQDNQSSVLKMQLKTALTELEQAKNTLATMEGNDSHAIKVALRMQKKITAKREKVDVLQSRIQFLEEALSHADKEKQHLKQQKDKLMQEHEQETAERQRLSKELEILHVENNNLKEHTSQMQAALDKTSVQLSECQAVIQRLEQESMCLRLQHALDLKELKVPTSAPVFTSVKPSNIPVSCLRPTDLPINQSRLHLMSSNAEDSEQSAKTLTTEKPTRDVINIFDKLHPMDFRDSAVHRSKSRADMSDHQHVTMEPLTLHTVDLQDKDPTFSFAHTETPFLATPCYTSSPKKCFKDQRSGARSPVHSLLTAQADVYEVLSSLARRPLSKDISPEDSTHDETSIGLTTDVCQKLQSRLDNLQTMAEGLQLKNREMSSAVRSQEKRMSNVKLIKNLKK